MNPSQDGLLRRIEEIERQIKELQIGRRDDQDMTMNGGTYFIKDSSGVKIAEWGRLTTLSGTEDGYRVFANDGTTEIFHVNGTNGVQSPWFAYPWKPVQSGSNPAYTTVTSGSFVDCYESIVEIMWGDQMLFHTQVIVDAATTAEVRLVCNGVGTIGSTKTITGASNVVYDFRLEHGLTLGTGLFQFFLEGRRTAGAGNVLMYHPNGLHIGSNMGPRVGGWP